MAIFPNTPKNDINSLTQIFNKKDPKIGKKIFIYLPTFSNFSIEKIFNLDDSFNKDGISEYIDNVNKDNFILEVNLEDERIENTPQYTISKKVDIANMIYLNAALENGLTEEINIFNTLKYTGEVTKYVNPYTGSGTSDAFYFSFLERNAKIIGLLESILLSTKNIPNKGITADRNLLLYGGDYENTDVYFLEQTNASNVYGVEETDVLKNYLKYPRNKNASTIKPIDRNSLFSVILLVKYINILQKKHDTKFKDQIKGFTSLLDEIIKSKLLDISLDDNLKNKNISDTHKVANILDLLVKNGLFYRNDSVQLVPGLEENPSNVKELIETFQWNYSGTAGPNINKLTSKSKNLESLFITEENTPTGFVAVENAGRLYIPTTKDTDKLYNSLKLEGRSELFGQKEFIILTQYPIKNKSNTTNKFIDLFTNNRNTDYMDGKIIDYHTYFKRFNNVHGLKSSGLIDNLKKDIELLFSIELIPMDIFGGESALKTAYSKTFKDFYKAINGTPTFRVTYESIFNITDLFFSNLEIVNSNLDKLSDVNIINLINQYLNLIRSNTRSNQLYTEAEAIAVNVKSIIKNLLIAFNRIESPLKQLTTGSVDDNFITENSMMSILYKRSYPVILQFISKHTELIKLFQYLQIAIGIKGWPKAKESDVSAREDIILTCEQIKIKYNEIQNIVSTSKGELAQINRLYNVISEKSIYKKLNELFTKINTNQKTITGSDDTEPVFINYSDCITLEKLLAKTNSKPASSVFFIETDDGKNSKIFCKQEITKILANVDKAHNIFHSLEKTTDKKLEELDSSYLMHNTTTSYVTQQDWLQTPLNKDSKKVDTVKSILENVESFKAVNYNTFEKKGNTIVFDDRLNLFSGLELSNENPYITIPDSPYIFKNMLIDKLKINIGSITINELENIINTKQTQIKEVEENVIRHIIFGSYYYFNVTLLAENLKKYNQLQTNFINKWKDVGFRNTKELSDFTEKVEIFTETKTKPILDEDINLLDYNNDLIYETDLVGSSTNTSNLDPNINTIERKNRNFFKRLIIPLMGKSNTNSAFYYKFKFNSSESLVEFKDSLPLFIDEFAETVDGPLNKLFNDSRNKTTPEKNIIKAIIDFTYSKLKSFGTQDKAIFDVTNAGIDTAGISEEEYDLVLNNMKATTRVNFKKLKKSLDGTIIPVHFGLVPYLTKTDSQTTNTSTTNTNNNSTTDSTSVINNTNTVPSTISKPSKPVSTTVAPIKVTPSNTVPGNIASLTILLKKLEKHERLLRQLANSSIDSISIKEGLIKVRTDITGIRNAITTLEFSLTPAYQLMQDRNKEIANKILTKEDAYKILIPLEAKYKVLSDKAFDNMMKADKNDTLYNIHFDQYNRYLARIEYINSKAEELELLDSETEKEQLSTYSLDIFNKLIIDEKNFLKVGIGVADIYSKEGFTYLGDGSEFENLEDKYLNDVKIASADQSIKEGLEAIEQLVIEILEEVGPPDGEGAKAFQDRINKDIKSYEAWIKTPEGIAYRKTIETRNKIKEYPVIDIPSITKIVEEVTTPDGEGAKAFQDRTDKDIKSYEAWIKTPEGIAYQKKLESSVTKPTTITPEKFNEYKKLFLKDPQI